MSKPTKFHVGDVIRTAGGKTPWRIESIGNGTTYYHRGAQVYRCVSLLSGRHEEYRVSSSWIQPWVGELPTEPISPSLVKGHTLRDEGAPHDEQGRRSNGSSWRRSGEGRGKCSCGALSDVLHSAGQRKQWHREHKAEVRAKQARA